ncbi:serine hydrolase domain-containing protein [Mycobacterium sp.]|uniref:serine hydrolase domain-containing protein n=1 Tax=Mycobacterium sp. TaxID=1785 RepID=UPI003C4B6B31
MGRFDLTAAEIRQAGRTVIGIGDVSHSVDTHSMRKSIMSALVGQACDRGQIDLAATLGELGIDDTPALTDEEKSATIEDLLAARSGVYLPADDGGMLGRPSRGSHPPGTRWCYNNWDFNVLGNVYERLTDRSVFVAFEHDLARPLGMADWDVCQHGSYHYRADIFGGTTRYPNYKFRLSARDIALLGQLYLNDGIWNGRRLLSPEWIARSTNPISRTNQQPGLLGMYGYCWWVAGPSDELRHIGNVTNCYSAIGVGGNFLTVLPEADAVVTVVTNADRSPMTNDEYQKLNPPRGGTVLTR